MPYECEVATYLETKLIGREHAFLESADSTNRRLMELRDDEALHGTVMTAETQTSGRGRLAHKWFSPAGENLYVSMLLRPGVSPYSAAQLPLVAASAMLHALNSSYPSLNVCVKWPNDILVDGRKLAGILCEMDSDMDLVHRVVVGFGINVNMMTKQFPPELRPIATSLRELTGETINRSKLLAAILNAFEQRYDLWLAHGLKPLLPEIEEKSVLAGRTVTVTSQATKLHGTVMGIAADGRLVLRLDDGTERTIPSGEVHIEEY